MVAANLASEIDHVVFEMNQPNAIPNTASPIAERENVIGHDCGIGRLENMSKEMIAAMPINAGVLHFDSLAKYAAASFKKSRSFLIFASSRLREVISSSRV